MRAGRVVPQRGGGGGRPVVRDDTVDADEDGVDERHEVVESARDEGEAAQRLDGADADEDVEQHRVVEAVEVVHGLDGPAARAPLPFILLLLPRVHRPRTRAADRDPGRDVGVGRGSEARREAVGRGTPSLWGI